MRESLKSDNSEEAHDESDESIAAQAVQNDTTIQELLFVEKVMQHLKQEIYWKCT